MAATIKLFGVELTRAQAEQYLKRIKSAYENRKTGEVIIFDGQELLPEFAKYVIEYLENSLR